MSAVSLESIQGSLKRAPKPVVVGVIVGGLAIGYFIARSLRTPATPSDEPSDQTAPAQPTERLLPGAIPVGIPMDSGVVDRVDRDFELPIRTDQVPRVRPTPAEPVREQARAPRPTDPIIRRVPTPGPTPTPTPTPTPAPTEPPAPARSARYPGVANPFVWNASGVNAGARDILGRGFDDLKRTEERIRPNDGIFQARNLSTIAIMGTKSPWLYDPNAIAGAHDLINQQRIRWGLYPLDTDEFAELDALARSSWPGRPTWQYAQVLFNRFNAGYQMQGDSSLRRR